MRSLAGALVLTLSMITGAAAQDLRPIHAHSIDFGSVRGVAYYTVETDGYRVVTMLATDEAGAPVSFVATLAPDQKVTIAVPREVGKSEIFVNIVRRGDIVSIEQQVLATN